MQDKTSSLLTLPRVIRTITNTPEILLPLSASSKDFYKLFSKKRAEFLENLKSLLSHAAMGEWINAENIWRSLPNLLTCRSPIFHPNRSYFPDGTSMPIPMDIHPGRYEYDHTAWQIALMNKEFAIARKMAAYMSKDEKKQQFYEIFPDGKMTCSRFCVDTGIALLEKLFEVICKDDLIKEENLFEMNAETKTALNELYNHVKPGPVHQKGFVFDARLYLKAKTIFDKNSLIFKNPAQRFFWCMRVEEYLASLMELFFLRHHAQGIENKVEESGCNLVSGTSIFPCRRKPETIPGLTFFVRRGKPRNKPEHRRQGPSDMPFWEELYEDTCVLKSQAKTLYLPDDDFDFLEMLYQKPR